MFKNAFKFSRGKIGDSILILMCTEIGEQMPIFRISSLRFEFRDNFPNSNLEFGFRDNFPDSENFRKESAIRLIL